MLSLTISSSHWATCKVMKQIVSMSKPVKSLKDVGHVSRRKWSTMKNRHCVMWITVDTQVYGSVIIPVHTVQLMDYLVFLINFLSLSFLLFLLKNTALIYHCTPKCLLLYFWHHGDWEHDQVLFNFSTVTLKDDISCCLFVDHRWRTKNSLTERAWLVC